MPRRTLVSIATGALILLGMAAPAAHAQVAKMQCVLPPGQVTGTAGVDNALWKVFGPDPRATDDGSFAFSGNVHCEGIAQPGGSVGGIYRLNAAGTYQHLYCGTGTANGTAVLERGLTRINSDFGITFAAGTGKLLKVITGGWLQGAFSGWPIQGGEGSGVIHIIPNPQASGGNCVTTDVTSFFVNGGWEMTVSG
jgi:hypothetical protein